jgi:hypothetical protein
MPSTSRQPPHRCPCRCGQPVPYHRFSCPASWGRLPRDYRIAIAQAYRRDPVAHAEAMAAARRWFEQHPVPTAVTR